MVSQLWQTLLQLPSTLPHMKGQPKGPTSKMTKAACETRRFCSCPCRTRTCILHAEIDGLRVLHGGQTNTVNVHLQSDENKR